MRMREKALGKVELLSQVELEVELIPTKAKKLCGLSCNFANS